MSSFSEHKSFIKKYIQAGRNVMLRGKHGIGKTALVNEACKELGLSVWYASAPLLDPDIDFGGIPVPNKKTGSLDFFAKPELFEAEVLFLDELNRASPRTLNMLFEVVQFHSVHGKKLPNLKCVVTGINPPGEGAYDVQELDPALMDRFHAFIDVKAEFPLEIIASIVGGSTAAIFGDWWQQSLSVAYVSPRRMEYAARAHAAGLPVEHCFTDAKVPVGRLREMLGASEMAAVGVVKPPEPWEELYLEPKFQACLNHPELKADHIELEKILAELNISVADVWQRVWENRQKAGQ